jgi:hypothetical protein
MNRQGYKTKRQGQPKRKTKSLSDVPVKQWTSPKLCQIYASKTEWAAKVIPTPKA